MPKFLDQKDVKTLVIWGFGIVKILLVGILSLLLYIRSGDIKKIEKIESNQGRIIEDVSFMKGRLLKGESP